MKPRTLAWLMAWSLLAPPSHAQQDEATRLFDEGRKLFTEGRFGDACPLFRRSHALDPKVGTLLNLAECSDRRGFIAESYLAWRDAEALAGETGDERLAFARENRQRVERRVARLTVALPPDAPAGTTMRFEPPDAEPRMLEAEDLGVELFVDDGTTFVLVEAPGRQPRRNAITLSEGERRLLRLELGAPLSPPGEDGGLDALTVTGIVVSGVGVAALAVGGTLGILAIQRKEDAFAAPSDTPERRLALCDRATGDAQPLCGAEGQTRLDRATTFAHASTGLFIAGGVVAAAGVTLLVIGVTGREGDAGVALGVSPAALSIRGSW